MLTWADLSEKTLSKQNFFVCLSNGLSWTTTSLQLGWQSRAICDLVLFSLSFAGLQVNNRWPTKIYYLLSKTQQYMLKKINIGQGTEFLQCMIISWVEVFNLGFPL